MQLNGKRSYPSISSPRQAADLKQLQIFKERIEQLQQGKTGISGTLLGRSAARVLHKTLGRAGGKVLSIGLKNRSAKIFLQIEPFITRESSVLDLGCGDGKVGELIAARKNNKVVLADVVNYNKTELPFHIYDGNKLNFADTSFDHVLLLTVLHHTDNPVQVMKEALRVAGKSVIVIESTYFNGFHKQLNKLFDWFYNKVLNNPEINVPFNFLTPGAWPILFEELGGRVTHIKHLGLDQPLVPEWHTLYVVRK